MNEHIWSNEESISCLSKEKIGSSLARNIAKWLKTKKSLYKSHRDYCGHGLQYKDEKYCIISVNDGLLDFSDVVFSFNTTDEFVSFMTRQSDYTMSGASKAESVFYTENKFLLNNQRLTKNQLSNYANYRI